MKVIAGLLALITVVLAGCGGVGGSGGSSSCGALTLFFGWVAGGACPAVSATVTTFAGTANSTGSADDTVFLGSADNVALDSVGNIYVTGLFSNAIRKITPTGVVTTFAGMQEPSRILKGGFADGTGAAARFLSPKGLAVDSNDNVYVADSGNSTIRKITSAGVVTTFTTTALRALSQVPSV
jgi:DNA-binding beta-propeller fold protein YncE